LSCGLGPVLAWLIGCGVLAIGLIAARRASRSPEEYFLAGRNLGTLILFMALFGTNCTAFMLVGVPGRAYRDGIEIFGVNAPIAALSIPLTFLWVGSLARRMAKRLGALTPAELNTRRFGSRAVSVLLLSVFTLHTVPYIVLTVKGSALTLAVIAFPHMLARLLAARDDRVLRNVCRLYPVAFVLLWIPAVLIGVWAAAAFPGLERPDQAFSRMSAEHLPAWMGPASAVVVLAAGMSTLDTMILTLSSMLVRDVAQPFVTHTEKTGVRLGRLFGVLIAGIVYALALVWGESIFRIGEVAFSGYVTVAPTLALGVRWRRFTAAGAFASLLTGNAVLAAGFLGRIPLFGFLPV